MSASRILSAPVYSRPAGGVVTSLPADPADWPESQKADVIGRYTEDGSHAPPRPYLPPLAGFLDLKDVLKGLIAETNPQELVHAPMLKKMKYLEQASRVRAIQIRGPRSTTCRECTHTHMVDASRDCPRLSARSSVSRSARSSSRTCRGWGPTGT